MASAGGPPVVVYLLRSGLPAANVRGTAIVFFAVSDLLALGSLWWLQVLNAEHLQRFTDLVQAVEPVLVSEHGVGIDDDAVRAAFIPPSLAGLKQAIDDGVPVIGYCHWSLVDNIEWIFGYRPKFGLASYDPVTFERKAKPSAGVLGAIARANALV